MNPKLKKTFLIFFILLCIGAIVFGAYTLYSNLNTEPPLSAEPASEEDGDPGVLRIGIAALPESDFHLFEENGTLILIHRGKETKFDWKGTFTKETVQMNFADYDGDGQNELAIVITKTDEDKVTSNELHILSVLENGADVTYRDTWFSSNSFRWNSNAELSAQQAENQKRVVLTLNGQTVYLRTPAKEDGSYYTFETAGYGICRFHLTPGTNEINSTVEVVVSFTDYKEACIPGNITSKLTYDGTQYVYTDVAFTPAAEWSAPAPPAVDPAPFTIQVKNADPKISTGLMLNFINFTLKADDTDKRDFSAGHSDERYLTEILLTESYISLVLPKMMSFNSAQLAISPPVIQMGGDNGFYIQAKTEVIEEADSYHLRTYFDEKISRSDFTTLVYHFGD